MTVTMNEYVRIIKEHISKKQITIDEFAKECGVPLPTMYKIVARQTAIPRLSTIRKINEQLGEVYEPKLSSIELELPSDENTTYSQAAINALLISIENAQERGYNINDIARTIQNCVEIEEVVRKARKRGATAKDIEDVIANAFNI